ncbi:flavodoxin-dependent (E)-4-hydroxy-3-methylbut-2-enyl-diphosphate synthase [Herbivorax alkaliphila]
MILGGCTERKQTKKIRVGNVYIGGDSPVTVQSMTNTDTRDINSTIAQIKELEEEGCSIVRLAVLDSEASEALGVIKKSVKVPLVADIHFDYRLAISAMENGADKIRLNPGNIGDRERVSKVVKVAKEREIPIRIGVNSGSLEKEIINKYGGATSEAMVESALNHAKILEEENFFDIALSLKASSVPMTIAAYRLMSQNSDYPLHLGVTEAGTLNGGTIKSSIGIGCLLAEGIGDTIRVSLTGEPKNEVRVGNLILKSLALKEGGIDFVSCPTCGRCRINLIDIANRVEKRLFNVNKNIKVAIMGCEVNGPGEAKEADIGIAGGKNEAVLFKKGEIVRKIPQEKIVDQLVEEVHKI